jgi:hypothetical protein
VLLGYLLDQAKIGVCARLVVGLLETEHSLLLNLVEVVSFCLEVVHFWVLPNVDVLRRFLHLSLL